ncbi:DinB family protein [uncultured Croceitalea sp.]|uniref:DinB family protein n=1 Tax=uncultured Croceitalea sp. TaxID=1798908 RepID=UPI00330579F1
MKLSTKTLLLPILCLSFLSLNAQYEMKPVAGYSPQIGLMVYMLENLKERITEQVKDLDQTQTDFMFDEEANSIGALIMHLVATEAYYQIESLEGRPWTEADEERMGLGGELNKASKQKLKGKPIQHYLKLWDEVRQKTLTGLQTKDDAWFASAIDDGFNHHWAWYHVMEHSANHMGQIALVKNRLPE